AGLDAGPDGAACTAPAPLPGKCVDRPPVCGDAGAPDGGCLADCQYHPPAGAQLQAAAKWQWGPTATLFPDYTDIWSTPVVGRLDDANCDGKIDELDPPNVVFVSGNATNLNGLGNCCHCTDRPTDMCHTGVLRMLDGRTGQEVWSLDKASPTSMGFDGL